MKTAKKENVATIANPSDISKEVPIVRIMARKRIPLSGFLAGIEENAKNHQSCIEEAKRRDAAKHGKSSLTDTEGNALRFLDPSVFRKLATTYDKGDAWRVSMIRCADYLTSLDYLSKAGVA